MPVLPQLPDIGSAQIPIDLQDTKHDAHELEMPVDLKLMASKRTNLGLELIERLNVFEVVPRPGFTQQVDPIVNGQAFDLIPKLKCCI
jgi:hypothetical protein